MRQVEHEDHALRLVGPAGERVHLEATVPEHLPESFASGRGVALHAGLDVEDDLHQLLQTGDPHIVATQATDLLEPPFRLLMLLRGLLEGRAKRIHRRRRRRRGRADERDDSIDLRLELRDLGDEPAFFGQRVDLVAWIRDGGPEPSTVADANFVSTRLLTLRTRNSAAYKGIHALLLLEGGLDFRTGDTIDIQTYFDEKIDIHHVFPQKWCKDASIDRGRYDSIVNKTPLSARTNRIIGGNAPSSYLAKMEKQAGITPDRMNDILRSHVIDTASLRADKFDAFFEARSEAMLDRIEKAMGKPARRTTGPAVEPEPVEEPEDDDEPQDEA